MRAGLLSIVRAGQFTVRGRIAGLLVLALGFQGFSHAAPGEIDLSFAPALNGPARFLSSSPGGQIVVLGSFTTVGDVGRAGLARLHADGRLDEGFAPSIAAATALGMVVLPDRRVLVAQAEFPLSAPPPGRIVALTAEGKVETTLAFDQVLKAADYDTNVFNQPPMQLLSDGTAVVSYVGARLSSGIVESAYFSLAFDSGRLVAARTILSSNPADATQTSGARIKVEPIQVGLPRPIWYDLLRWSDETVLDGSFRISLGEVMGLRVAVQPDDRLLVAMTTTSSVPFAPPPETTVRRYRRDGTLDPTFSVVSIDRRSSPPDPLGGVVVVSERAAVVGGDFKGLNGVARPFLARIDLGEPEPAQPPVVVSEPESIDALVGQPASFRVQADGIGPLTYQWSFEGRPLPGETNRVLAVSSASMATEGRYWVEVTNAAGTARSVTASLTLVLAPGGGLDPSFDPGSGPEGGKVTSMAVEPDGRLLVGGTFTRFNGRPAKGLIRLREDGSFDPAFEAGRSGAPGEAVARLTVDVLATDPEGRIVLGGVLTPEGGPARTNVYRLRPDGTWDTTFRATPGHPPTLLSLAVLPDGGVLAGGTFNYTNNAVWLSAPGSIENFRNLVRLRTDGSLDTSFRPHVQANQSGSFPFPYLQAGAVRGIVPLADGKVLAAGALERPESGFARLNTDGSRDGGFDARIIVSTVDFSRGGVPNVTVLAGNSSGDSVAVLDGWSVMRFTAAGRRTGQSHNLGLVGGAALTAGFQSDGKAIIGGRFGAIGGMARAHLARALRDGTIDRSFGTTNGFDGEVTGLAVAPSGALYVAGRFGTVDGIPRPGLARVQGSGRVYRELMHPIRERSGFSATVQTLPGRSYTLEVSSDAAPGSWTTAATLGGDGRARALVHAQPADEFRFYRLRID